MATGKKINELNSISTVTDSTVFPAVYVEGSTTSDTATKVSISQLKTNLQEDFYTKVAVDSALNNKQDKLTAGDNITIAEDSDENLVISAAGGSVPENVYTQDNLVAGTNISIADKTISGGIDNDTLLVVHFNDNYNDSSNYSSTCSVVNDPGTGTLNYITEIDGATKFEKFLSCTNGGTYLQYTNTTPFSTCTTDFTFDLWFYCVSSPTANDQVQIGMAANNAGAWWQFGIDASTNSLQIYLASLTNYNWVQKPLGITIERSKFHHAALTYESQTHTISFYLDGIKRLSINNYTLPISSGFDAVQVGGTGNGYTKWYIDEFRFSKCLRWTSDFEVPAKEYDSSSTVVKAINNTMSAPSVMTGATSGTAGTSGLVPAPASADRTKFLKGDASWGNALENKSPNNSSALSILGEASDWNGAINIGYESRSSSYGTAVGYGAKAGTSSSQTYGTAVGYQAIAQGDYSVAFGWNATTGSGTNFAVQLGFGTNNEAQSLYVGLGGSSSNNYKLLDSTGTVPMARLPIVPCTQAEYDALVSAGTVDANTIYCIIPA